MHATWAPALAGRLVVFEGPDGSGKSTQFRRLVSACEAAGVTVCEVREPGGTAIGEEIRRILLHTKDEMNLRCEMLLYMASRAQLVEEKIRPALDRGCAVLSDRFVHSTYAYQGAAGGIPAADIDAAASAALQGLWPDLTVIFDVDRATAAKRTRGTEQIGTKTGKKKTVVASAASLFDDRIEQRNTDDTFEKIRNSYLEQAMKRPTIHTVIDARGTEEATWGQVEEAMARRFGESSTGISANPKG